MNGRLRLFFARESVVEGAGWIAVILAAIAATADVIFGVWDHDGGFFLQRAAETAAGFKPYLDIGSLYPPLMELMMAPLVMLAPSHILLAVVIPVGWVLVNIAATAFVLRSAGVDRGFALLIGALFAVFSVQNGGNHLTLEHGVTFFGCLAFGVLVRPGTLTPRRVALAAMFASAATLMKQNGVVVFLPIVAMLIAQRAEVTRRHVGAFVGGALILPALLLVWLEGKIFVIYDNVVSMLHRYAEASDPTTFNLASEAARAPETVLLFATAIALAVLVARSPRYRWVAIAAAAGAVVELLPRYVRNYSHYNLNAWAFIVLTIALALASLSASWQKALRVYFAGFALIAFAGVFLGATWGTPSPLFSIFYPAARTVYAVTPPNALVRQYGSDPIIEFLAYRQQEAANKPETTFKVWDGSGMYATPPDPTTTVVILGNKPWLPQLQRDLHQRGFVRIDAVPRGAPVPFVQIYKHRAHLREFLR
jgi:hypothetical protein